MINFALCTLSNTHWGLLTPNQASPEAWRSEAIPSVDNHGLALSEAVCAQCTCLANIPLQDVKQSIRARFGLKRLPK